MMWMSDVDGHLKGSRILLIDDSEPFLRLTTAMLEKMGVESVDTASTLAEGMHYMRLTRRNPYAPGELDLVIMDVNLPDGNGMHGCEFLSGHAATHNIPVVVSTGTVDPFIVDSAFRSGASDFLTKPLVAALLKRRLGLLLRVKALAERERLPDGGRRCSPGERLGMTG